MKAKLMWLALGVAALLLVIAAVNTPYAPPRWTADEIQDRVDILNENAAVVTPHRKLGKETRERNLQLFEKVERGQPLSEKESATYRVLYQSILKDNQSRLALFDRNMIVMTNVGMQVDNNVSGHGIRGSHDHHDMSSNSNFVALQRSLGRIERADGAMAGLARISAAIAANKDLTDIILHMGTAPQTKSVKYRGGREPSNELEGHYESMMVHYKRAQFESVNSPEYVDAIHTALDNYDAIVAIVQNQIFDGLSPLERTLSGRWGSWQSLSPSLGDLSASRIPRTYPPRPALSSSPPSISGE